MKKGGGLNLFITGNASVQKIFNVTTTSGKKNEIKKHV